MRGYAIVALDHPQRDINIGSAMRAVGCYGASLLVVGASRKVKAKQATDTYAQRRHTPMLIVGDVFDALPHGCVPVAVDLVEGAQPLPEFTHPERAFYVFGAENATLGARILDRCQSRVMVPTLNQCMNLAAAVNVILYDRMAKEMSRVRRTALAESVKQCVPQDRAEMLEGMIRGGGVWSYDDDAGKRIIYEVNCNDLWSWASADAEEIPYDEIENCYKLGPITWACVRRNLRPFSECEKQMKEAGEWNALLDALPERSQRG